MKKKILFSILLILSALNIIYADENEKNNLTAATPNTNYEEKFNSESDDNVTFDKKILGSNIIFGDKVEASGEVKGINLIFGNNVISKNNNDYGFVFGNNVTISGNTNNDGAIFGNNVTIDDTTNIGRDVAIFANTLTISGHFGRNIEVYASNVNIKGATISGNITIHSDTITIDDKTTIKGTLKYPSNIAENNLTIEKGSQISNTKTYEVEEKEESTSTIIWEKLTNLIGLLIVFSALYLLVPNLYKQNIDLLKSFGYGVITLLLVPIAILLLRISIFGLSLGLLLLALYILIICTSTILVGPLLGEMIYNKIQKNNQNKYLVGLLGITTLYILKQIPILGGVVTFITISIAFGLIISLLKRNKK